MVDLILLPIIPLGIIIGLYELFAIHSDMNFRGSHWFGHGLHSVGTIMIALFIVMNTEYFLEITNLINSGWPLISNVLAVRIAIGLILNLKIHATSAIAKGRLAARGMAEHWTHTLIVSALVVVAPYVWPILEPIVPYYLGGLA